MGAEADSKSCALFRMLKDVNSDQQVSGLEQNVIIDRDTAARLGITPSQIDNVLYDAFGQREISTIYQTLNQYHVVLEVDPQYQMTPSALESVYVITSTGAQVPLSSFAHFGTAATSLTVNHQGQFPAVTISFNLAPGASLGAATRIIEQTELEMRMPATIHGSFQGTAAAFQDSLSSEPLLILTALIAVYIVLGILYESYIHPITILSTLPSAGTGAIAGAAAVPHGAQRHLAHRNHPADRHREEERHHDDRLRAASGTRGQDRRRSHLRSGTAALPSHHDDHGCGYVRSAAAWRSAMAWGLSCAGRLGVSIVGGLIVSQMLTLYTTPVVYIYLDRFQEWLLDHIPWRKKKAVKEETPVFAD